MTGPLWTSAEIAKATGGQAVGADFDVFGLSIDTRSIEQGDLFIALAGVRDGHEFVEQALAKGAAGSLASRTVTGSSVQVPDVLVGLEQMGVAARNRASTALRGAITGSVGKTSLTQAVSKGLAMAGRSHASIKSYNNHIGVPLTLARMPRDTERAVFEIGMNHADEIDPLSRMVRPHAVCISTVGPVHIENFPDGEAGVARAKAEIFAGLEPGGTAILNVDNHWFDLLAAEAKAVGAKIVRFGAGAECEARLTDIQAVAGGAHVRAVIHGKAVTFPILQSGAHWGHNSLAALMMMQALGVDLDMGIAALGAFEPLDGRGAEREIGLPAGGTFTLIDESYNANPLSMAAVLRSLGGRDATGRKIVALTDMLELGEAGPRLHAEIAGAIAAAGVDQVYCSGPLMKSLWDALPPTQRGGYATTAAVLAAEVVSAVEAGDVVMVKGSNGSKASVIAAALAALDSGERG
ncbi:MAG: UDP-N-acetylmuramoylalanyl-D-glutamyl-2,6-diaminopimelate--D-alanyl-D-alanyl ligase [Pseudomonadota bacterium]